MQKIVRHIIFSLLVILVIFLSLDIKKLDVYKGSQTNNTFNAKDYATDIWNEELQSSDIASDINIIVDLFKSNPGQAFNDYGKKLGISKTWYFLVKGSGVIESIEEEFIVVITENQNRLRIATDFIFGNAVRDGSGLMNIDDFINMTDFNNVSVELNKLVKTKVVSQVKENAETGKQIKFTGTFEINEENSNTEKILIIPVTVSFNE